MRRPPQPVRPPLDESSAAFAARHIDADAIFGRLFTCPDALIPSERRLPLLTNLYDFVEGMNSLDEGVRFDEVLTPDEEYALWLYYSYREWRSVWRYSRIYEPVVEDMVAQADARIASGQRGADLRFGHDYVVLPLVFLLDLNGSRSQVPVDADHIAEVFTVSNSPMAANVQLILYRPRHGRSGEVLVKALLNGREATFPLLTPVSGPYYRWEDLKAMLLPEDA